jgi:Cu(I)/Ag(I) efflux system membrane fusion protein
MKEPPMKTHPLIACLLAVTILALGSIACKPKASGEPAAPKPAEDGAPSSITLKPDAMKTAGIRTAAAETRSVTRTVRAVGEIAFNPKRTAHVNSRTPGRIEKLFAYQGDKVRAGQVLILFYSKDFASLQTELVQALERSKREGLDDAERRASVTLLDSARNRLRLLDLADDDLAGIEKTGQTMSLLPVRAPIDGTIIESLVNAGDYMDAGVDLFRIADLTSVWAELHVFEKDIASVRTGSEAVLRAAAFPGRIYAGRIFQLGGVLDEKTRTIEARIDLANPDGDLRPGMYVDADIRAPEAGKALFVPAEAVQDFQNKKIVFVRTAENTFAPRDVETGAPLGELLEIRKGLKEGDVVAAAGSFFLKSELLKKTLGEDQP